MSICGEEKFSDTGLITKEDHRFIVEQLPKITGWLHVECAYFTAYLLNYQLSRRFAGPALEIGVYHGRYMALLVHSERKRGGWVGGYDIFLHSHQDTPIQHFKDIFGTADGVATWKADSRQLTPRDVMVNIGKAPRFISVDGDHSPEGTEHDLHLVAAVGMEEVIIAADDFLNSSAVGASEGIYRFLLSDIRFVPFAYAYNKLFLCRREYFDNYSEALLNLVNEFPFLELCSTFNKKLASDPGLAFQRLMGNNIGIFA